MFRLNHAIARRHTHKIQISIFRIILTRSKKYLCVWIVHMMCHGIHRINGIRLQLSRGKRNYSYAQMCFWWKFLEQKMAIMSTTFSKRINSTHRWTFTSQFNISVFGGCISYGFHVEFHDFCFKFRHIMYRMDWLTTPCVTIASS